MERFAKDIYEEEKKQFAEALGQLKKKQNRYGWLRLGIVILTGVLAFYFFSTVFFLGWVIIAAGIASFLLLVSADANNNERINRLKLLVRINEEELNILLGNYLDRSDGADFAPALHNYANDLDIFGKASLYQYINRCSSEQGRALLAHNLLQPLRIEMIEKRQEAIKELTPQYQWRQALQQLALENPITLSTQQRAEAWMSQQQEHFTHRIWNWLIPFYSVFTVLTAIAAILGYLPLALFSFLFLLYFVFAGSSGKKAMQAYAHLNGIVEEINTIYHLVQWVELKEFQSSLLRDLQQSVKVNHADAYVQIGRLKDILNRFDMRLNVFVFIFVNSFLLWDVRQMRALNKWRKDNEQKLSKWFALIAEMEVLNSLATLHFNQPVWAFPEFKQQHFSLEAKQIGHPLISSAQRVTSDFDLRGRAKIALVTGSNMAGKSTFLRSLGVNIVLAQAGAVVCAQSFVVSPVSLLSSMRIADNLAENTSTFYAELKKLKTIIEAVNRHEPVFILLDEILRGTNSLDRHTGSKALIQQLIKQHAVAVIATHDVALAELEETYPLSVENYHFDVQVEGEELYFDYKLKHGVCTSLNASILMKKIGIEM